MRVLVTGGSGFVGSHVVSTLLSRDYSSLEVFTFQRHAPKDDNSSQLARNETTLLGNIESIADVQKAMTLANPDLVINLAGVYAWWQPEDDRFDRVNVLGVQNLIAVCISSSDAGSDEEKESKRKTPKLVQVSTVLAFGNPALPSQSGLTPETAFDEDTAPGETASRYASSKHQGDLIVQKAFDSGKLDGCTLFLACCIGKDPKLLDPQRDVMKIQALCRGQVPAVIAGETTFTYVYVKDAAEAIVRAGEKLLGNHPSNITGQRFLIGNQRLKTDEYYDLIAQLSGTPKPRFQVPAWLALWVGQLSAIWSSWISKANPTAPADLVRTATRGTLLFRADKSVQELGMEYTNIKIAFREAVDFVMQEH